MGLFFSVFRLRLCSSCPPGMYFNLQSSTPHATGLVETQSFQGLAEVLRGKAGIGTCLTSGFLLSL